MNLTVRPVTVHAEQGPRQIAPQVMHTLGVTGEITWKYSTFMSVCWSPSRFKLVRSLTRFRPEKIGCGQSTSGPVWSSTAPLVSVQRVDMDR